MTDLSPHPHESKGQPNRFLSRKFLLSCASIAVAVLVAAGRLAPEHAEAAVQTITGATMLVLTVLGYVVTEASVDKERAKNNKEAPR